MVNYQAKDLTKNVQILLKKSSQQFMLARILDRPEFLKFLSGETPIRVFTPDKNMFLALLRMDKGMPPNFRLEPRGPVPAEMTPNMVLLLVFPSATSNYIAQCMVEHSSSIVIGIRSLDPRVNERRKTLLPTTITPVPYDVFKKIGNEDLIIRRSLDFKDSASRTGNTACRDMFIETRQTGEVVLDPENTFSNQTPTLPAIMADISTGGCALQLHRDAPTVLFESTQFGFLQFDLPIPDGRRTARVFALIRQIRRSKGSPILHCMFLEPLPDEFLEM